MYTSYTPSALALRAKWSCYQSHFPLSSDYYVCGSRACPISCISCSQSSLFAVSRSPRFIYYGYFLRRHSSLFQLLPSRTLLIPRRTVRVCDGGFDELIGLLEESQRCCKGEGFASNDGDFKRSSRKEGSWGDFRDSPEKKRTLRKEEAYRGEKGNGSRSKYSLVDSSSFPGDFEDMGVEKSSVVGETSRGHRKKGYGIGRADVQERVVQEVRKHEDDENFCRASRNKAKKKDFDQRIRDEEGNKVLWRDSDRGAREKAYVYGEPGVRNGRSSSSGREVSEQRSRVEDENVDDWMGSGHCLREECVRELEEGSRKLTRTSECERCSEYKKEADVRNADRGVLKWQSETDKRVVGQADFRKSSLLERNVKRGSDSQSCLEEDRIKDRKEKSTSVKNFIEVMRDEKTHVDHRVLDKVEVHEQCETHASNSRFLASDTERANSSKSYLEIRGDDERQSSFLRRSEEERMKYREDKSTSVENLVWVRDERTHGNQQTVNKMEISNEQYENQTNSSIIHARRTETASNSKSSLRIRAQDQEEQSTSVLNLVHGVRDNSRVEPSASEVRSGIVKVSNFPESSTIRTEKETASSVMVQHTKDNRQRSNLIGEHLLSAKTLMGTGVSSHGGSSSVYQVKDDAIESASRYNESSEMYAGEFVHKLRQQSLALDGSEADEEKTHKEAYQETTALKLDVDDDISRCREKYKEESGRQSSSRSGMKGPSDEMWEVRGMSSQEPSKVVEEEEEEEEEEEQESLAAEVVDSNTSTGIAGNDISRRSHRSLWTYIADIMKIGWGHRAGSHSSAKKSGTTSLSNESISSEIWFSGHEPDENDDEIEKKERDVSPKESVHSKMPVKQSQDNVSTSVGTTKRGQSSKSVSLAEEIEWSGGGKGRQLTRSSRTTFDQSLVPTGNIASPSLTETGNDQMQKSNSPRSEDFGRQKQPEVTGTGGRYGEMKKRNGSPKESTPKGNPVEESNLGPSTSMGTMRRALSPKGVTLVSGAEDFESSEGEKRRRGILYSVDQSSVLTAEMAQPSIPKIGRVQMASSGSPELEEVTDGEKLPEVGGTEEREGELKRMKLQRNKQVLKEQFDEWEETYKHQSEQRKVDEFFMREALLEAKKAADTWEVPVGAVLVQNGKIIARGCNLVEELRDSTAHAEMICIREASSLLQNWRLAETTLYVTLEPCPMCAGAILQARIDSVVWGAPNKLLGADGSWVRLFPSGDGGSSSFDPSNQIAGPVHPFHPKIRIRRGILATECSDVMQQFFQLRRKKNKKPEQPLPPSCLPVPTQPTKLFASIHDIFCMMFCL